MHCVLGLVQRIRHFYSEQCSKVKHDKARLAQLAHKIKRLVMLAYSDANYDMVEVLSKDCFIEVLGDPDTK